MNQFLSNKIIAGIVAVALLVGVGVLVSSGDTSSTTRNAALVVGTPCTKVGQVTKVSKQAVVCAALSPKNIWYPVLQEKKWICAKLGITRKQNGIFSVCGKNKSSRKRWFLTKPLMSNSNPGLPTTDQDAFIKLTTNPELIVETSPTTPIALAATTTTTPAATTETTVTPTTVATTAAPATTPTLPSLGVMPGAGDPTALTCAKGGTCKVGDIGPGGGKVFYVAPTPQTWGTYLEAAPTDYEVNGLSASLVWGCDGISTEATATAIGTGKANTATILLGCTMAGIAADVANKYSTSTAAAGQWFLPSRDELNELCKYARQTNQALGGDTVCIGGSLRTGFVADRYRSSSDFDERRAWHQYFDDGRQYFNSKSYAGYVRPVRAF